MNLQQSMKSFVTVVEEGSFTAAAEKTYCSSPKISKDIQWLEDELSVKLFIRTTRKVSLTEAGENFYRYAKQTINDYQEIKNYLQAQKNTLSGTIRITCPNAFYEQRFIPIINAFLKKYPDVKIEAILTSKFLDLYSEKIDLAVRIEHPNDSQYNTELLLMSQRGIFASPKLLKKLSRLKHPNELINYPCLLHTDISLESQWILKDNLRVSVKPRLVCNSVASLIAAAVTGLGFAYFSETHIQNELASGELKKVYSEFAPSANPIYICHRKQEVVPKKVLTLIAFIKKYFKN